MCRETSYEAWVLHLKESTGTG
ncbi:hypothetical protein A2U01_0078703, partial [Trifolium medium]|nr:hypothetical protein [Trifolium medium]